MHPSRSRRAARHLFLICLAVAVIGPAPGPASATSPPSVKLVETVDRVRIRRIRPNFTWDLGIWLGSVGGAFELRVSRPSYADPVELHQVDAETGTVLRTLDASLLDGWLGLKEFFRFRVEDMEGRPMGETTIGLCPNSWERERVDDAGPLQPVYPEWCWGHPLTKGMVWGIEEGWATPAVLGGVRPPFTVPDGRYVATLEILEPWASELGVAPEDASGDVIVRVRTVRKRPTGSSEPPTFFSEERRFAAEVPEVAQPDPTWALPDLQALPSWGISIDQRKRRELLTFGSTEWNAGPAPLVVEGFRKSGDEVMQAYQYFFENGSPVGKTPAGQLEYHDARGHNHWHFEQFVRYSLLDASMKSVVRSRKRSFCLVPTDPVDLTVEGAEYRPGTVGLGSACGRPRSIWIRETIPAGWGDTYFQTVAGQAFRINKIPNGIYYIRIEVNPHGLLFESDDTNQVSLREIRIRGREGKRRVVVPPYEGIDTECFFC